MVLHFILSSIKFTCTSSRLLPHYHSSILHWLLSTRIETRIKRRLGGFLGILLPSFSVLRWAQQFSLKLAILHTGTAKYFMAAVYEIILFTHGNWSKKLMLAYCHLPIGRTLITKYIIYNFLNYLRQLTYSNPSCSKQDKTMLRKTQLRFMSTMKVCNFEIRTIFSVEVFTKPSAS